ncbi:MAG: anthranilate phosphoribosyltransferase [Deltaproteobacteria bacterium]|nr:anthranilate phosphoribosyltransferase [Deltaproteobacteria bacterium]
MLKKTLNLVLDGRDLTRRQAREALHAIMSGECADVQIAGLLAGLRTKGETGDELAGFAETMRNHATRVQVRRPGTVIDTCGTGGDGASTFNISTAAALVAAAGGAVVAKHGNRSISSKCGSADVLEALGVPLDVGVKGVEACIEETGIGFLFAPHHHPAMKHVMPVRRAMGVRTAFNLLGPLTNPAGARRQVLGVFDPSYTETVAWALQGLGAEHVMVVCGEDGQGGVLDEISTCGETVVAELRDGEVHQFVLTPEVLFVEAANVKALRGGDADENAAAILAILGGEPGPRGDAVAVNAGAALYVGDLAGSLKEGIRKAKELLATGAALHTLEALKDVAQREAAARTA